MLGFPRLTNVPERLRRTLPTAFLMIAVAAMALGALPAAANGGTHFTGAVPALAPHGNALAQAAKTSLAHGQGPAVAPRSAIGTSAPLSPLAAAALGTPWTSPGSSYQPSARATPTLAYDPVTGYVVYFGGGWNLGTSGNDTWTYSGGTWTNISSTLTVSPGAREDAAMTYDAADGYVLLFGGYAAGGSTNGTGNGSGSSSSYALNDTWTFQNGVWNNITSSSTSIPAARFNAALIYDYIDGYAVLFGGTDLSGIALGDTWTFLGGAWTDVSLTVGTAPSGRVFAAFTYDSADREAVLFGGSDPSGYYLLNDTWTFFGGTWASVNTTVAPPPLRGAVSAYDTATGQVILFGGAGSTMWGPWGLHSDTWAFAGGTWANLNLAIASSPPARFGAGFTNTSNSGTLLMADGCLGQGCMTYLDLSDSWTFNMAGPIGRPWIEVTGTYDPSPRATPTLAYDPVGQDVVYFGGGWDLGTSASDTWTFANGTWTNITSSLTVSPTPREGSVMAYDAADGYIVLFGGYASGGPYSSYVFSDTWKFQGGAWTNITSLSAALPPGRFVGAMTYDYTDGVLVLYGGDSMAYGFDTGPTSDTWTFHAGNWTDVTSTAGTPPAGRDFAGFTDDPSDGYALLFGGWNSSSMTIYNDTWTFAGGAWAQLNTTVAPIPLRGEMMAYEPVGQYVLMFGGVTYLGPAWPFGLESQTWAFKGGNWTNLTPFITTEPPARFSAGITNISTTGEIVMVDGCLGQGCIQYEDLHDTWIYNWTNVNGTVNLSARPTGIGNSSTLFVRALGGDGRYSYAYTGLPTGCTSMDTAQLACVPTVPGNYSVAVHVFDASGRSVTLALNYSVPGQSPVTTPPVSVAAMLSTSSIDLGQSTILSASASGGSGGPWTFNFAGLPPGCAASGATVLWCVPASAGQYQITTTATDRNGTSASTIVHLSVNPAVTVEGLISASAIDVGETLSIGAHAAFGSTTYSYGWSALPQGCAAWPATSSFVCTPTSAGFWTITVSATDTLGQSATSAPLLLTVNPRPTVTAAAAPPSSTDPLSVALAATLAGGTGPVSVAWSFGDGTTETGANVLHTFQTGGTYSPTVWTNDSRGIGAVASVSVTVHPASVVVSPPGKSIPVRAWNAALGGDAGTGLLLGLLALSGVAAWGARRRRALAEGRALVDRLAKEQVRATRGATAPGEKREP